MTFTGAQQSSRLARQDETTPRPAGESLRRIDDSHDDKPSANGGPSANGDCRLVRPIVVVGAGRSGTTMIREALGSHPMLAACPYEMNYLWRYGNGRLEHDMLLPESHAAEKKAAYIRRELVKILAESGKPRLVEKTVANVMRLSYVHFVLPDAAFIHVIRDGRAVTASAMERWRATPSTSYLASKASTIPLRDLFRTGLRYLSSRLKAVVRGRGYIQSWGPRWPGFDRDVSQLSLAAICAKQWMVSVRAALEQKDALPAGCYLEVRYEDIVTRPVESFGRMAEHVGVDPLALEFQEHISNRIRLSSLDKWKTKLSGEDLDRVMAQVSPFLAELSYR